MKMTFFAFGSRWGCLGFRSYIFSLAESADAANAVSRASIPLSASAPNPTAESCSACLRVKFLFIGGSPSIAVQEIVCAHEGLQKETQTFFLVGFFCDRLLRHFQFPGSRRTVVSNI